jgi:signal transduction histidine kinase
MMRRRWALVALGAVALVWALGGEWASIHAGARENHFLDAVVGLSFLGGGIMALDRRPGNALGPLMVAYGFTWFVGNWSRLGIPVFPSLFFVTDLTQAPILVHIALSYPSGRLRTPFDRFVVGAFYVTAGVIGVLGLATFPRRAPGCGCPWTPLLFPNRAVFDAVNWISDRSALVFVPLVLSAVVLRWRRASRAERRALTPLWISGTILAFVFLVGAFASADTSQSFPYLLWELRALLEIAVPIIFVWGVLSTRLARSAVGDLVVELERIGPRVDLEAALARALGDRSLEVAYALEGEDRWVDAGGLPVALPVPNEGTNPRAVTLVERDGAPVAALIHDPALDEGLVRAAGAAAGMAIANEQLRAEVRAQLEEVRASRERIVEAGDRERRRVERNLHDGAQQRLVTLSLALAMLRERPDSDPSTAVALGDASAELRRAIEELRELARGIHPAILTEEGLLAGVESLADRSSVPVRVLAELDGRLPESIEATAYFVVGEALANVAKYADASGVVVEISHRNRCLTVEVHDDGRGGADPGRGTGIRGLEDRVSAVGGRLRVDSPSGRGTRISVEIPT